MNAWAKKQNAPAPRAVCNKQKEAEGRLKKKEKYSRRRYIRNLAHNWEPRGKLEGAKKSPKRNPPASDHSSNRAERPIQSTKHEQPVTAIIR